MKVRHAKWIVEIFNKFQTDRGKIIIKNGFRKSAITAAIEIDFRSKIHLFNSMFSYSSHLMTGKILCICYTYLPIKVIFVKKLSLT